MEEMDTEDQPATESANGGAADIKTAETGTKAATKKSETFTVLQMIKSTDLRKPLLIACALQAVQQFSGINAVFFYSKPMFEAAEISAAGVPFAVVGTNAINVVATVVSVFLVDKAGRRRMLLIPELVMAVDLIFLTISFNCQSSYRWLSYMSILFVLIYVVGFAVSLGPIPMMVTAEMFRQGPRPMAMSIAGVSNWIFTFIVVMGFPPLESVTGKYTFIIFSVLLFAFVAFTYFFVPETKDKTFEQTAHRYHPSSPIDVQKTLFNDDMAELPVDDGEQLGDEVFLGGSSDDAGATRRKDGSSALHRADSGVELHDLAPNS